MGRLGYRPSLDGLRAIAIIVVVSVHTFRWPTDGTLGVDLFFVLSGFLITTLLLEEHASTGAITLRGFYGRRVRRLGPALLALLIIYTAVTLVRWPSGVVATHLIFPLTWTTNLAMAGGGTGVGDGLQHLWSLAAEEQFYLLWPVVLILLLRGRRGLLVPILVVIGGICLIGQVQAGFGPETAWMEYSPMLRSANSLIAGCMAALILDSRAADRAVGLARAAWIPAAALCLVLLVWTPTNLYGGWITLFAASAAVLVVRALDQTSLVARALSSRPMVYVGKLSYSLYLWHLPILVAVGISVASLPVKLGADAVAVCAAMLSYRFIEQPFRRRRTSDRQGLAAVTAIAEA